MPAASAVSTMPVPFGTWTSRSSIVTLTSSGTQLLPYAAQVGQLLSEARRAVADEGQPSGPLVIGSLETTAALRLPETLANFTAQYSAVDVTLRTGTTQSLIKMS